MWQKVAKFKGAEYFRKALYLQIRHVISSFTSKGRFRAQLNEVETLLATVQSSKDNISYIYRVLSEKGGSSVTPLKIIWEKDLGLTISDELWRMFATWCTAPLLRGENILDVQFDMNLCLYLLHAEQDFLIQTET
jgi:hypothetical protein